MVITNQAIVQKTVIETLIFCFNNLIPSLFPFMVISSVFCKMGLFGIIFKNDGKNILGICKNRLNIVMNSWLCGYLVGPKFLCNDDNENDITPYIFLTSNAGVGFVILYVGNHIFHNLAFGIFLYLSQILSSMLIFLFLKKTTESTGKIKRVPLLTSVCESVRDSTKSILEICGFTVFILVIKEIINNTICIAEFNHILDAITEISTGIFYSASVPSSYFSAFLVGFVLGFGGIAIYLQTLSVCTSARVKKIKLLVLKLIQGLICGVFSLLFVSVFKIEPTKAVSLIDSADLNIWISTVNAIFIFCCFYLLKKVLKKKILY